MGNIEIIKLLLTNDKLDINIGFILNIYFYKIQTKSFFLMAFIKLSFKWNFNINKILYNTIGYGKKN